MWLAPVIAVAALPTADAKAIKIGWVNTLTTPASITGKQMKAATEQAMDEIGHKMGGSDVVTIMEGDGVNPKTGNHGDRKADQEG